MTCMDWLVASAIPFMVDEDGPAWPSMVMLEELAVVSD